MHIIIRKAFVVLNFKDFHGYKLFLRLNSFMVVCDVNTCLPSLGYRTSLLPEKTHHISSRLFKELAKFDWKIIKGASKKDLDSKSAKICNKQNGKMLYDETPKYLGPNLEHKTQNNCTDIFSKQAYLFWKLIKSRAIKQNLLFCLSLKKYFIAIIMFFMQYSYSWLVVWYLIV